MLIRRSRAGLLVIAIALLHIVLFSLWTYNPDSTIRDIITTNLSGLKQTFLKQHDRTDFSVFNAKLYAKFQKVYLSRPVEEIDDDQRKLQLYQLDMTNDEKFNSFVLPPQLAEPDELAIPELLHFDPRFTFGILLNYVSKRIELGHFASKDDMILPFFHWADYVDTSILQQHLLSHKKTGCEFFDHTTASPTKNTRLELFDPALFCVDDQNIDTMIEELDRVIATNLATPETIDIRKNLEILKRNKYSTGFHIFGNPGRSAKVKRVLEAKSYLNDFMPPPLSINMLLPNHQNIHIKVNQDVSMAKRRMKDCRLLNDYVSDYRSEHTIELQVSTDIVVNVKDEITRLAENLNRDSALVIPPANLSYFRHMDHLQFIDKSEEYVNEIQSKLDGGQSISFTEFRYLESLKVSMSTFSPPKYFSEAKIVQKESSWELGGHYDWRFFNGIINYTDSQPPVLFGLLRAWLRFTNANNFSTWIAHGSLLSWYWNGMAFPWDNDIDVQMPVDELHRMARSFNQSIIVDFGDDATSQEIRYGRYFLDVGTFITQRMSGNGYNNIDARFIDIDTGLYIDITGLALTPTRSPDRYNDLLSPEWTRDRSKTELERNEFLKVYNCRNNHFSLLDELSPLKMSIVEGQVTYVPNGFEQLLVNEYHEAGLSSYSYKGYEYIPQLRQWMKIRDLNNFIKEHHMEAGKDSKGKPLPVVFSDEDFIKLIFEHSYSLFEYLVSNNVTEFHESEIIQLIETDQASEFFFDQDGNFDFTPFLIRHDYFTYLAQKSKYDYGATFKKTLEQIDEFEKVNEKLQLTRTSQGPLKTASP
ncbi:uncharacterized protein CANTADRAFT_27165 [Suhomyces tanzawaensis NRRL Y-17324]|uniref:LicD/FKTN/FKRP nucleotidyltransferase domain-containing protein n=1 Tax=Suhomyces tanzawaensis NRRL Y-17324 TaxID=984487 RepID=A0A1E4SCN0_9ASCO|nr:uncharacterized protein CANTADRAFT_27165 [Suhomyces tanzawaensis NRRL Y-17324]ODV77274.1 hypothetical protein CANTADRAFT_27165 [Suhomyces tanzawaensis NRRL Y-17324]